MKVLLINKFLYPKGGDAICTLDTGKLLRNNGHNVVFWGMDHPDNPEYPYKELFVNNVDFQSGGGLRSKLTSAMNILYSREAKRKIKKLIEQVEPDIVHLNNFAHQISPSILDAIKQAHIPTVMTMHDYKLVCPAYTMTLNAKPCYQCKNGRYYRCAINKCTKNSFTKSMINTLEMYLHHRILKIYNKIDTLISPSIFLKKRCDEMGLNREIIHLPNFVEISDYSPQYESTDNTITFLGRVSKEKGIATLIEAVRGTNAKLKIIGDGPLLPELKTEAQKENIDNITFMGYMTGDTLQNEIKKSKACVLPSECYENNPRSVIEAFALGKPVIGARIGGIPELVRDGETGWTFESGNADDLRAKIEILLCTPHEKIIEMGKVARKNVENYFNPEHHYKNLIKIYERAIKGIS